MARLARRRGLAAFAFATAIVGVCAFVPARAEACSGISCEDFSAQWFHLGLAWTEVDAASGAVVIAGVRGALTDIPAEDSWSFVDIEVTAASGELIEGTWTHDDLFEVAQWAPTATGRTTVKVVARREVEAATGTAGRGA